MGWPKLYPDFHRTINYEQISKKLLDDRQASLSVLHGKSGNGKSSMALALVDDLIVLHQKAEITTKHVKCWLISSTTETLMNGMIDFCKDQQLEPSVMEFDKIVECLNKDDCALMMKWFVFDDIDMSALLTQALGRSIARLQGDDGNRTKWRIIITTKREVPDFANHGVRVNEFLVDGFTIEDSRRFFSASPAMETRLQKLQERLSGSPLALRIAKTYFTDLSRDDVMEKLEQLESALEASVCNHDQKKVVSFLEWIIQHNFPTGIVQKLLGCIAFFDENNISEELLHSCMEALNPEICLGDSKKDIEDFRDKIASFRLTTQRPRQKLDITIHQLTREALRISFHEDPGVEKPLCRSAMNALSRCQDIDGRFSGAAWGNLSENVAHAKQLVELLSEKPEVFVDQDMKLMLAELLYASAYADLKKRSACPGFEKLKKARDLQCKWLTGMNYTDVCEKKNPGQTAGRFDAKRVGEKLYKACKMIPHSGDYKLYAKGVQQYRRLTDRDRSFLKVGREDINNDHLTETALKLLRKPDNKGALDEEQFIKLFPAECVALVFYLIARVPSFWVDDCPIEQVEEAIYCAQVARSMYEQIQLHHKVLVLNYVLVRREELQNRLELMMRRRDQLSFPANGRDEARNILDEYKGLLDTRGDAYEYGLKRSKLEEDNYHRMVCYEGMLLCHGWLVRFSETAAQKELDKREGIKLYEACRTIADSLKRRYNSLSNVEEYYAKFLYICKEPANTVCKALVDAIIHLEEAIDEEKKEESVVQQGRFTTLCSLLKKYVAVPVNFDDQKIRVVERYIKECERVRGRKDQIEILKDVIGQKMQQSAGVAEEHGEGFSDMEHPERSF